MKNYFKFLLSIIVILSPFYSNVAFAQNNEQRFHDNGNYFLRAGYSLPTEEKYNGGLAISLGKTFNLIDKLNLEIEGLLTMPRSEFIHDESSDSIGTGDLTLVSINLNLNYYLVSSSSLGLYIKAGAGYSFNGFSPTAAYEELGFTIEEELNNSIQLVFGAGTDLQISSGIILNLDVRYTLNSTSGTWLTRDEISGAEVSGNSEATFNLITIMLGFRLY